MEKKFEIKIEPFKFYGRHASQDFVLCGIGFDFFGEEAHSFRSVCNDRCLSEIISKIDAYFGGRVRRSAELYFADPLVIGGVVRYPFSFRIEPRKKRWIFRYSRNGSSDKFDFEYPMSEDDVRHMRDVIENQYSEIDWQSLGKSHLYMFGLPNREFEWCYSARAFEESLNGLCRGRSISSVYVSALNYADPLRVEKNLVNYFIGSEIFIQLDGVLLNLLIFASGLFKWRVFDDSEVSVRDRIDFIQDGDNEFCKIHDVYNAFQLEYRDSIIDQVTVGDTDDWPWFATGFDKSMLGDPIELPEEIFFRLENGNTLSFVGWDDDFAIRIK